MGKADFLDDTTPTVKTSQRDQIKRAEKAFFSAMDASNGARGCLRMNGGTWKLVSCGLAPYGGIGELDEWGVIWFDSWRLKLKVDSAVPDGVVEYENPRQEPTGTGV